jgi:hypothetical protein
MSRILMEKGKYFEDFQNSIVGGLLYFEGKDTDRISGKRGN